MELSNLVRQKNCLVMAAAAAVQAAREQSNGEEKVSSEGNCAIALQSKAFNRLLEFMPIPHSFSLHAVVYKLSIIK